MRTIFSACLLLILTNIALAQPGTIDGTFGTGGRIIISEGAEGSLNTAYQVAIQTDGKIITTGAGFTGNQIFVITRHHSDGSLDNSFSDDGIAYIFPLPESFDSHSEAYGVAITADGKIVITGEAADFSRRIPEFYSIVIRLNSDGTLDESFNGTGILALKLSDPNVNEKLWGVAIQADGKIIANGSSRKNSVSEFQNMTIVRINTDGTLDAAFGVNGIVRLDPSYLSNGTRVELQANGKIVAVGNSFIAEQNDFVVIRLNNDGSFDNSFEGDGIAFIDFGGNNFCEDVQISALGKIIVGGYGNSTDNNLDINVARLLSNGTLDNTFDGDGKKLIDQSPEDIVKSLALQNNGSIIICGYSFEFDPLLETFVNQIKVTKLNENGSLDLGFASDGSYEDNFGNTSFGMSCALQTDDKIVVVGWANDGVIFGRALTRINNRPVIDCNNPAITGTFNNIQVLPSGVTPNTLYVGYLPASVSSIKFTVNGNSPPYEYTWSSTSTNSVFVVNPFDHSMIYVLALRMGVASFTVLVRDSRGCEASFTKTITIKDIRCGNKLDKVLVCHVNKNNPDKSKTICISPNAVPAMLNNGSYLGECTTNSNTRNINTYQEELEGLDVKVINNPSSNYFTFVVNSSNKADKITIRIMDQLGNTVERKENQMPGRTILMGYNLRAGFYFAELVQNGQVKTVKLIKK